ncbi:O-methyltransferas-like protein [Polyplosphaeria fusca]|uniref:O-methyltransferas-like protein n=1 Tax=Polyplosphaeria fusca TaxID=682080 RepID=A0A9P4UXA7_9PLEO|nr:O-methyltransferas-like protein [Polyplosphaeria fusca]
MATSQLLQLAQQIQDLTSKIVSDLSAHQIPEPNFTPSSTEIPETPETAHLRASLNDAATDLLRLVNGPRNDARNRICTLYDIVAWQAACEFGFFDAVPEDGGASISEIAVRANVDEERVGRFIRILATDRIFEEKEPGRFWHTARSVVFLRDRQIRDAVHYQVDEYFQAAAQTATSVKQTPDGFTLEKNPFVASHGAPLFQYYKQNPTLAARFASAMAGIGRMERQFDDLKDSYAWATLPKGKLIDIGGGNGHYAIALARTYPNLEITVQDSLEMMAAASLQDLSDLSGRVSFMQHNFFTAQPIACASAYLLRQVTHNWSDEDCIRIFRGIVPALEKSAPGTPLLVNDVVLPRAGEVGLYHERRLRQIDIMMMVALGAGQRSEGQFGELLRRADERLKIVGIHGTGNLSLMEVHLVRE